MIYVARERSNIVLSSTHDVNKVKHLSESITKVVNQHTYLNFAFKVFTFSDILYRKTQLFCDLH